MQSTIFNSQKFELDIKSCSHPGSSGNRGNDTSSNSHPRRPRRRRRSHSRSVIVYS